MRACHLNVSVKAKLTAQQGRFQIDVVRFRQSEQHCGRRGTIVFGAGSVEREFSVCAGVCVCVRAVATLLTQRVLSQCLDKIETINYHEEKEVNGIRFWCYNAGHVLGAGVFRGCCPDLLCVQLFSFSVCLLFLFYQAMFMVEIDGTRVLYTGDFSRQTDRHLMVAEIPSASPGELALRRLSATFACLC